MSAPIPTYRVTLDVVGGQAVLDVPSLLGPEAAGRRAYWTAAHLRWGDLDEIHVVNVELLDQAAAVPV